MNPNIVDPLPAGAMTFTGKTQGPAVNLGRARPHQVGGRMIYAHLDELRDWVVKAGWHTEADFQKLLVEMEEHLVAFSDLAADHAEALDKIDALEKALGWKQEAPKVAATKTKTKAD